MFDLFSLSYSVLSLSYVLLGGREIKDKEKKEEGEERNTFNELDQLNYIQVYL